MKDKFGYITLGIIISIFTFCVVTLNKDLNEGNVTASTEVFENKKIGWGIKRAENHEQPDLGSSNLKILQESEGIAIGNDKDKYIYLTFDEGYEAGYTSQILDTLKENNVKATFFITSHYLNTASDLVGRMINEGHIVRKPHFVTSVYAKYNR